MKHVGILLVLLPLTAAVAEPDIRLTAVPPTEQVRQTGEVEGYSKIRIQLAKGETESYQIVVTAMLENLRGVEAEAGEIEDASGNPFPSDAIAWYREAYVPIRHSAPRAQLPPGLVPDPLVPFVDPYTGDPVRQPKWSGNHLEGSRFGGGRFDLWRSHHQPLWIDVHAPRDLPAGVYQGKVSVRAKGVEPVSMPIEIEVWDFELPEGPTHQNHFGPVSRIASYYGLKSASPEFEVLEDRYSAMLADHRINPAIPHRLLPSPDENGKVSFPAEVDAKLTEFVGRYHVTDFDIPRAPFGDPFGKDREKVLNFYRSWYEFLEGKDWADRAYFYMQDEPNDATAYEHVRDMGALVAEADPGIRKLVVEQTYTQDPEWVDIDEAIDIWCPLFGFIDEGTIRDALDRGDEVWSYSALIQTAPDYHPNYEEVKDDLPPFWQIDFPSIHYRIGPWINRRYGITGLLYWSTVYWGSPDRNPWDDPGFRVRWNGDGFLMYP
ncbi:MAG: DUF4091 domain-containing protein, partial [Candidatus Omnitrophica bacterium]|nr:DUF4091 domain-containing protein [Candidatus Omnitrophota bacterium]